MKFILSLLSVVGIRGIAAQVVRLPVAGSLEASQSSFYINARDHGDSKVVYGKPIEACVHKKHIAVTVDDGPSQYTQRVLEEFKKCEKEDFKATFFVTGNNLCPITDDACAENMRDALKAGRQIASHTWRHKDLNAIDTEGRHEEMDLNKDALAKALGMGGKTPTYMRPSHGTCSAESGCLEDMGKLGYHVVNWNIDTSDWMYCESGEACQTSVALFDKQFNSESEAGFIVLSHDIMEYTASVLIPHVLKRAKDAGFKVVTVGECLGDPKENWYKKW